jgi:hypothetical protein
MNSIYFRKKKQYFILISIEMFFLMLHKEVIGKNLEICRVAQICFLPAVLPSCLPACLPINEATSLNYTRKRHKS